MSDVQGLLGYSREGCWVCAEYDHHTCGMPERDSVHEPGCGSVGLFEAGDEIEAQQIVDRYNKELGV